MRQTRGMTQHFALLPPELWMQQVFEAKAAREGGVVGRRSWDVERIVGRDAFLNELRRRGYHAVENAGQLVIFCNQEPIRLIT